MASGSIVIIELSLKIKFDEAGRIDPKSVGTCAAAQYLVVSQILRNRDFELNKVESQICKQKSYIKR